MEFFLKEDEALGASIQRIIDEQIEYALSLLKDVEVDRDFAVHESRKTLKKVRAMFRLVRHSIGVEIYQHENIFYRDVGRTLAPIRDSFVLVEVLDKVKLTTKDKTIRQAAIPIRRALMKQYRQTRKTLLANDTIPQAIAALEAGQKRLKELDFTQKKFKHIAVDLQRSYRRGKKRMTQAYKKEPLPELFHDWRKRVKDLWYQTEILSPVWPAVMPSLAEQIHKLSEILGDAHDLAVLHDTISNVSDLESDETQVLLKLILDEQQNLEGLAYPLGCLVYAESPPIFVERITSYWQVWQKAPVSLTLYMPIPEPI